MADGHVQGQPVESNQMSLAYESLVFNKREGEGGRLGCTLVTGFLGSGKTTLVHHILHERGDLRIAVLVNEFADLDIDSLLLDDSSMNPALGLPALSLASGCACCTISGSMREVLRSVLNSKHNFDYLVIETSGIADPQKIAEDLELAGVHLDIIVTVVDAEALESILDLPVAKRQLAVADVVLVNKCDLASLSAISVAEDRIEEETGGTKAVRCRFCKVPLSLVINVPQLDTPAPLASTMSNSSAGFLSHEAIAVAPPFLVANLTAGEKRVHVAEEVQRSLLQKPHHILKRTGNCGAPAHAASMFFSTTFSSDIPIPLGQFQDIVVGQMHGMRGLLRAKGVVWFSDFRGTRFLFHWSGKRRVEAVYGGKWESQPHTSLVLIGRDNDELEQITKSLSHLSLREDQPPKIESAIATSACHSLFSQLMGSDKRFKIHGLGSENEREERCSFAFGLVGAPLRGVYEADLNAALMRLVNGRGVIFLAAVTSRKEDHVLYLCLSELVSGEDAWKEISFAATTVVAKGFKDVCPCRCDLTLQHKH